MDRWDKEENSDSKIPSEDTLRRRNPKPIFYPLHRTADNEGEMYRYICINCKFICFAMFHTKIICDKCVMLSEPRSSEYWERE